MAEVNKMIRLVQKAQHGDVDAYGKLIEYYKEYLYKTAWLYVGNEQEALDIVQDTILKAFRQIRSLREVRYFKTWMTRILINCAKDICKQSHPYMELNGMNVSSGKENDLIEKKLDLHRAIGVLPEIYRSVIILKYYNELKIGEIANILQMPKGTVSVYLTRAKQELKKYLKEDYLDE